MIVKKTVQIGVMGSMTDVKVEKKFKEEAVRLGKEIAKNKAILVYGFEGDFDSLPTIAAKAAQKAGGLTTAFLWGPRGAKLGDFNSVRIETGQQRGGGREFPLVLSCDAIICLGGGSGTLTEIAMAYQFGIPVVAIKNTGGWSDKLAGTFLDERKRMEIFEARNAKEAVSLALKLARKHN